MLMMIGVLMEIVSFVVMGFNYRWLYFNRIFTFKSLETSLLLSYTFSLISLLGAAFLIVGALHV